MVGKTAAIAMPDATVITGKAGSVQADALEVQVTKSINPTAWAKGLTRVPRATLRTVEMRTKSVRYRTIGTVVGFAAGFAGGLAAAVGTAGGYAVGNAADRRSTTIEIVPE